MSKLQIAKDLELPLDAVTQKLAWLGRTGSGKTYGAKRMVEQMLRAGAQVVILDPVGVWPGLRLGPKAFDVPVLGGLFGDIPLESTAGALIADLVVNHATSMVIDVSQMLDNERTRFAQAFGERFFQRKKAEPGAVHLVIEECQEFIPQNHQHGEERMLHEFQRIAKLGRNFGIGLSLISQRPQEVNKKALNQAECVLAFQMTGPQERKALEYWLSDKGFDGKLSEILPRLEVGAPHVWSPQWLKISKVIRILPIDSLDTSQTPKVGDKSFRQRKLEPIDLKTLTAEMASTLERAKADDPKALRARISELEESLAEFGAAPPAAEPVRVEVPVFDEEAVRLLTEEVLGELGAARIKIDRVLAAYLVGMRERVTAQRTTSPQSAAEVFHRATKPPKAVLKEVAKPGPASAGMQKATNGAGAKLPTQERLILTALAQQHPKQLTRERLALMVGCHRNTKTFVNALGALRGRGAVDELTITDVGLRELGPFERLPSGRALIDWWCQHKLHGKEVQIIRAIQAGSNATREALAEAVGCHRNTKTFVNGLGRLRGLGLVDDLQLAKGFS